MSVRGSIEMFDSALPRPADLERFRELGYLVLPGFLPAELVERLKPEVDRWVDEGLRAKSIACCLDPETHGCPPLLELEMPAHGELVALVTLMVVLTELLGPNFVLHHLHSDRHAPGAGKRWHHDYEQRPQTNRTHVMVHALHYLDGLDDQTASLVVLPGSQREVVEKSARAHLGLTELPGEVLIDRLPPGSTVVLHSAVFHARRPQEDSNKPRYMIDASYCQVGVRWPPVKPYWRYVLQRGRELGLDDGWPELLAQQHFTEYVEPD